MSNVMSTTKELLRSGEYSDFTLVCEGQKFPVHKSIVCLQSSVIATALKSEFQEAKTNTMEVDFEPQVLKSMLDYMYTGQYDFEEPAQPVQPLQDSQPSQPAKPTQPTQPTQPNPANKSEQPVQGTSLKNSGNKPIQDVPKALMYHTRVNGIADYYGVTDLAKLSAAKVQWLLKEHWSANAFCELMQEVTALTGDKGLREALAHVANQHIFELVGKDIFSEGKVANDIAALVLKASLNSFASEMTKAKNLRARLRAGNQADEEKIKNLEQNLTELADVLSSTRTCCKRECHNTFGCAIQRPTQNDEKRWFVRCAKCNCRHIYNKKTDSATLAPPPRFDNQN
ncbi:hypothetical protein F4803DRAFT_575598 [Xylaria telfairii]|nr:hypothetical protein F4803DRAFT_575598 [Xylaria telfairii]